MSPAEVTHDAPAIDPARLAEISHGATATELERRAKVFEVEGLSVSYSGKLALDGATLDIAENSVTAFIGPSGCGKSTFIRCFNRMNDLIPGAKVEGAHRLPRARPLRREGRPGRGAAPDRDGVPEAEPVPEVDLRQHRVRAEGARAQEGPRAAASSERCARLRSGTRSGTGSATTRSVSPAVSSSASASRARSPSSRT